MRATERPAGRRELVNHAEKVAAGIATAGRHGTVAPYGSRRRGSGGVGAGSEAGDSREQGKGAREGRPVKEAVFWECKCMQVQSSDPGRRRETPSGRVYA